jgi:pimeloyl-ACP methyl ester carboxylesterase
VYTAVARPQRQYGASGDVPFAGGSSSAFRRWRDHPMAEIALSLVTWPGRDRLRHLAPLSSITQLASLLADELEESVSPDAPLLLAGHSMGAQVAFETCRLLEQRASPQGLIISGCHAPHLHSRRRLSDRDDADFIAELIDIGGCSPELRKTRSYCRYFFLFCALIFTLLSTITTTRSTIFRRCARLRCSCAAAAIVKPPGRRWRPGVRG